MDRKSGHEVGSVRVRFEAGRRRAVLPDGPQDLGNTRATAFREIQFLSRPLVGRGSRGSGADWS